MIKKINKKNIFSSIRLRQILNDIKRRPIDAASDIGMKLNIFNLILNGKKEIDSSFIKKAVSVWPIKISDFVNPYYYENLNFKIMRKKDSIKTSRTMQRGGNDYYEYQDTVMERNAPFKPEWIRVLHYVKNDNAKDLKLKWNKGHLLHQFTYFVGEINFYYKDRNVKKVIKMNTGDSVYISPYVPHTFATRNKDLKSFIIAITFADKINTEIQNELVTLDIKNLNKNLFSSKDKNIKKISFIKYDNATLKIKNNKIITRILAKSNIVPNSSFSEIILKDKSSQKIIDPYHRYIYLLSKNGSIKIDKSTKNMKEGDTVYLKPFTSHKLLKKDSKFLIMSVEGNLNLQVREQLSKIGGKNLKRILYENSQWF